MGLIAAIILLAEPVVSPAQQNALAPPRGTNSAGTAQSSGRPHHRHRRGVTRTGRLGSGRAVSPATSNTNAAIGAEKETIDRKLESICRGC